MAASILPTPGTEYGPCWITCSHLDCEATRKTADSICPFCTKLIGYERRYYRDDIYGLTHASCLEDKLDGNR